VKYYLAALNLNSAAPPAREDGMPFNVWNNSLSLIGLYGQIALCYEKMKDWNSALEYYNSAAEEVERILFFSVLFRFDFVFCFVQAFADPLMAKTAMRYQEKATMCESML
jgi:hypothetical protein